MTLREAEMEIQERWMMMMEEERFRTGGAIYEAEKTILERLAPEYYSRSELLEFVFFHMHGMTPKECVSRVPDSVPKT